MIQNHKLGLGFILICCFCTQIVSSKCSKGCDLALASYYMWDKSNLTFVQDVMQVSDVNEILAYNPEITNKDVVKESTRVNVPFSCNCINGEFLGYVFQYKVHSGDVYDTVAKTYYSNLTSVSSLENYSSYDPNNIPDTTGVLNVTVNCSCGDASVSKEYGLFVTYPLRVNESLSSIALTANVSEDLLKKYNPGSDFSAGSGIVFIPGKDKNGTFPPFKSSTGGGTGLAGGAIIGFSIAGVAGALLLAVCVYICFFRKKKVKKSGLLSSASADRTQQNAALRGSTGSAGGGSLGLSGITVDKSVEFSYEELAKATDNFSLANKIGQGGFGAVYYADLRGERAAIKKMDMQASKEFLAELKVLTHVHHLNLVRLIGYCVEGSLFLVYEFMENGNLSEHLHEREPLSWSTRVQIALDSARGLEYIHEHTVPVYIHRDIKTANILIDTNYHGKVADFGLTKLTEVGGASLNTRLVGTFGYMAPEYAQYGDISPKVDVYAFGVVLYELISALDAIVKINGSTATSTDESKGLVALFEEALNQPDSNEDLRKLIDSKLGDNYPFDSVRKMAQLAKACTHDNPQLRPSMRSIVVALMTLSSATEDWDVGSFYDNQPLVNLMSGR